MDNNKTTSSTAEHQMNLKSKKPYVGLSACLAGFEVRYDGKHKRSSLCLDQLSQHLHFETFCPEMAANFGTPRPAMRLIGKPQSPTLAYVDPQKDKGADLAEQLTDGFKDKLSTFGSFDGYILVTNSPSCGTQGVKVFHSTGALHSENGIGLFAAALKAEFPQLPLIEEAQLHDPKVREDFLSKVFSHHEQRRS